MMPRTVLALLLLLLAAPASAEPALWRVADEDTTVYLFGTIHVLPDGYEWRGARIEAAIEESDELVLEALLPEDLEVAARMLIEMGVSPGLPPLDQRVPVEERGELAAMIARGPIPKAALDHLETWAAALMLVGVALTDLGLEDEDGVEDELEADFEAAEKPITGLEAPREQLGFLDGASEAAQRALLVSVIDTPEASRAQLDAMLAAWARGDEAEITATFDRDALASPALREALLTRRNANWARWIAARMERPGTVLVAVGAAHLVGQDSVQEFLSEAGIEVERVQ